MDLGEERVVKKVIKK
ncbi:MAG: hypothetical protein ACON4Y_03165 [Flavobacteriales bacterium]